MCTLCYDIVYYFWHDYILSIDKLKTGTRTFLSFDRTTSVLYWQFDSTLKKFSGSPVLYPNCDQGTIMEMHSKDITLLIVLLLFDIEYYFNLFQYLISMYYGPYSS